MGLVFGTLYGGIIVLVSESATALFLSVDLAILLASAGSCLCHR